MLPTSIIAPFIAAILAGCTAGGGVVTAFSTAAAASRRTQNLAPMQLSTTDTTAGGKRTTSKELIPREKLFGNPENPSPLLSPDGPHLPY